MEKKQTTIRKEKINKFKEKVFLILNNKKLIGSFAFIIAVIVIGILVYRANYKKVIHDVSWGMSLSEVKKKEQKFSGIEGYYDEDNNYYAVSEVDFFGENVTLLYRFEEKKLTSISAVATYDTYKSAYNIAHNICIEYGMPISFEDKTDLEYLKSSILTWNIDGTTIALIGNYDNNASYSFLLEPYDGNEFGEDYTEKGICRVGSALSWGACENEIAPWNIDEHCYEHGCYIIGCPNGFEFYGDEIALCHKHHFLCE